MQKETTSSSLAAATWQSVQVRMKGRLLLN